MNPLRRLADRWTQAQNAKLHHQNGILKQRIGNEEAKNLRLQRQIAEGAADFKRVSAEVAALTEQVKVCREIARRLTRDVVPGVAAEDGAR